MTKLISNPLIYLFKSINILNEESLVVFHEGTRDMNEINVMLETETGSLILDKCIKDLDTYYLNNSTYSLEENKTILDESSIVTSPLEDDIRRFDLYKTELKDLNILDFGCGKGGFLRKIKEENVSNSLTGIELNKINRHMINSNGINCYASIKDSKDKFDLIFLNHVFEHLTNPIDILNELKTYLKEDGKIIIEVPHGDDFLIKKADILSFKNFTFWSEHICLYTEKLINKLFDKVGVKDFYIYYYQRYNLNNHINWFKNNKPGGHITFELYEPQIIKQYNEYLSKKKITDTLIIVIGKKSKEFSDRIFK
jgi:2-polyprenyl-3-methyl-5-hydroxy-6-metoxy-1,4-benzoquinol methylase